MIESPEEYARLEAGHCPNCGSGDVTWRREEAEGGAAWQRFRCSACQAAGAEMYGRIGHEIDGHDLRRAPADPVWIVLRGFDEVDVFTSEEAAREHAGRLEEDTLVREETVAHEAWAPQDPPTE